MVAFWATGYPLASASNYAGDKVEKMSTLQVINDRLFLRLMVVLIVTEPSLRGIQKTTGSLIFPSDMTGMMLHRKKRG